MIAQGDQAERILNQFVQISHVLGSELAVQAGQVDLMNKNYLR